MTVRYLDGYVQRHFKGTDPEPHWVVQFEEHWAKELEHPDSLTEVHGWVGDEPVVFHWLDRVIE
jgi:hypothetical protein